RNLQRVTCGASSSGKRCEGDKLASVLTGGSRFRFPGANLAPHSEDSPNDPIPPHSENVMSARLLLACALILSGASLPAAARTVYHIQCSDGPEMHVTMLTAIGTPGEFVRSCDHSVHITVGPATPANSPDGGGFRAIPDRTCIEQFVLVPPGQSSDYSA